MSATCHPPAPGSSELPPASFGHSSACGVDAQRWEQEGVRSIEWSASLRASSACGSIRGTHTIEERREISVAGIDGTPTVRDSQLVFCVLRRQSIHDDSKRIRAAIGGPCRWPAALGSGMVQARFRHGSGVIGASLAGGPIRTQPTPAQRSGLCANGARPSTAHDDEAARRDQHEGSRQKTCTADHPATGPVPLLAALEATRAAFVRATAAAPAPSFVPGDPAWARRRVE